jgi:ferrous iron transport protein A
MTTLDQLKLGESGVIANIKPSEISIKLLEMGVLPGKLIRYAFKAPFGGPMAVQISGCTLSLRLDEAKLIELV